MDHMEFGHMLDNYENLSESDKQLMEAHAKTCESCRKELDFYRSIIQTVTALPVIEPPSDLLDKVNSRIDSMPKSTVRFDRAVNNFRVYRVQYAAAAACLAVGLIVGLNSGVIRDKLDPAAPDGVISETTRVSDKESKKLGDYELADEIGEKEPERKANEVVADVETPRPRQTVAPTDKPSSGLSVTVPRTQTAPQKTPAATARPASVPAVAHNTAPSAVRNTAPATAPRVTQAVSAPVQASITEQPAAPVVTEAAAVPTEQSSKSRYTIARGNYYIPETAQANVEVTEEPSAIDTEIASEGYQIAMGSYEISEDEKRALSQNKLIVNESDIAKIIECMNSSWIKGADSGYTATRAAFANFLSKLDAEGIYYNYIQLSEPGDEVYFVLLAN